MNPNTNAELTPRLTRSTAVRSAMRRSMAPACHVARSDGKYAARPPRSERAAYRMPLVTTLRARHARTCCQHPTNGIRCARATEITLRGLLANGTQRYAARSR
ncbi:MAG: hypothetical protein BWY91_02523 [bacterium ADurb.BinA028]|nr:MAG: hypothetical protein BWY91_02523 [bacterium ADurb.BinA028]